MTLQGHIENGSIVFENPISLPEGTKVTVLVQPADPTGSSTDSLPSLFDRLQSVAGKAHGLPAELAINHDHYLHGSRP